MVILVAPLCVLRISRLYVGPPMVSDGLLFSASNMVLSWSKLSENMSVVFRCLDPPFIKHIA